MSIVRILLGVIVGGCILAALLVAAVRFPTVAGFLMFGAAGCGLLYVAYRGLRTGLVSARRSRYTRTESPFGFWFYIVFYALIGALVFGYGLYAMLLPVLAGK